MLRYKLGILDLGITALEENQQEKSFPVCLSMTNLVWEDEAQVVCESNKKSTWIYV